ncbi:MAG: sigma-70 family RNA polymerase sigma factor [Deltaproteobacteria bacterium]|nr:sigma-70 family RNA polymerase sigma factor [Deltaproteobacteria bacterium]
MSKNSMFERCLDGDPVAWEELFRKYSRAVFRWSLFFGLLESGAEEATQEVFMIAFKKISKCPGEEKLSGWLFQITRRHAANTRRKKWFKEMLWPARLDTGSDNLRKESGAHPQLSLELEQVLRKLPIKMTEVLILHDLDGLTRREIAAQLGIPNGTVASRLNKARSMFRDKWNPVDRGDGR